MTNTLVADAATKELRDSFHSRYMDDLTTDDFIAGMARAVGHHGDLMFRREEIPTQAGYLGYYVDVILGNTSINATGSTFLSCFENLARLACGDEVRDNYERNAWPHPLIPKGVPAVDVWPITRAWLNMNGKHIFVQRERGSGRYTVAFSSWGNFPIKGEHVHLYFAFKDAIQKLAGRYANFQEGDAI